MIIGVDHVALSCGQIDEGAAALAAAGYPAVFLQKEVPNHPEKRPYLSAYEPFHAIAYCNGVRGASLELTQHSAPLEDATSPYQVLFSGSPAGAEPCPTPVNPMWSAAWREALGIPAPRLLRWPSFRATFWSTAGPEGLRAILLPVRDREASQAFWTGLLGWRLQRSGAGWSHLAFHAPIARWSLDLVLVKDGAERLPPRMDDAGFPVLALLTGSVGRIREELLRSGAPDVSSAFQAQVGGKALRILLARGPDCELVEFIEIQKPVRGTP